MGKIHSVAICKKETFEQWKRGELLCFDGVLLSPIDCVSSTTKYKLTINEEYTVIAENIMKAKQELLRMFSDDIDRVIDKKLGDYGFCSENI